MSERDEIDEIISRVLYRNRWDRSVGSATVKDIRNALADAGYSIVPSVPMDVDPDIKLGDGLKKVGENNG